MKFRILKRVLAFLRGLYYKKSHKITGNRLEIYPGVHIHRVAKNKIICGEKVSIYHDVGFYMDSPEATIHIGNRTYINRRTELKSQKSITIGDDCAISWDCTIMDTDYHSINNNSISKEIIIGNHVWIGCKSTILKGCTIGDGAIIAAGALVNRDVPPATLVGGVPARVLKTDIVWK